MNNNIHTDIDSRINALYNVVHYHPQDIHSFHHHNGSRPANIPTTRKQAVQQDLENQLEAFEEAQTALNKITAAKNIVINRIYDFGMKLLNGYSSENDPHKKKAEQIEKRREIARQNIHAYKHASQEERDNRIIRFDNDSDFMIALRNSTRNMETLQRHNNEDIFR